MGEEEKDSQQSEEESKPEETPKGAEGSEISEVDSSEEISEEAETTTAPSAEEKEGCFIATAAYGTRLADEVAVLSEFRDRVLAPRWWGRAFVRGYYVTSPPVAEMVRRSGALRCMVRIALRPLIAAARVVSRQS